MSLSDPAFLLLLNGSYQPLLPERAKFSHERGWIDLVLCSTGDWLAIPTQRMLMALGDRYSVEAKEYHADMMEMAVLTRGKLH